MNQRLFLIIVSFCVLDTASLFLVARYLGVFGTLFLVLVSTTLGLLACARWIRRLSERHTELRAEHGDLPPDVVLIHGSEGLLSLLALVCFLFPGLLSDVVGFVLALPRIQADAPGAIEEYLRKLAASEGKSIHQLFCE